MAQQTIDITPVTGDSGQSGGTKINDNFTELYASVILRESLSNKATSFGTLNNTLYPSVQAVETRILQAIAGMKWKDSCAVATTANITLSGEQTIDGILTSASRILVKNQSSTTANGIYVTAAGAWARSSDADVSSELEGAVVTVQQGTSNANTTWAQTSDGITLGSTTIVWAQFGSSVPTADASTLGIAKLYPSTSLGSNTDGAPTQNASKVYADAKVVATISSGDTTHASNSDALFTALALKVALTSPATLTDGASVAWDCGNNQFPEAKWTCATAGPTLTLSNIRNGSAGTLKLITNTASVITITFATTGGLTHKSLNTTFTSYAFPAGTGKDYFLTYFADGTTLEWIIGVVDASGTATWGGITGTPENQTDIDFVFAGANLYLHQNYR